MWVKLLGAVCTVAAATSAGLELASRWSGRSQRLGDLRTALQFLGTEMSVGRTPLPEAAAHVASLAPGTASSRFFAELSWRLRRGEPADSAWRAAAQGLRPASDGLARLSPGLPREEAGDLEPLLLLAGVIGAASTASPWLTARTPPELSGRAARSAAPPA